VLRGDEEDEDDVDGAFAALCADYAAALPRLSAALAVMIEEAALPLASPTAKAGARAAAHRIRGTAGSYGFHAVGEAAGAVEDALDGDPEVLAARMRAFVREVEQAGERVR
jgi:HPt (histidine-containing phosphotransfer) domain-containing protein